MNVEPYAIRGDMIAVVHANREKTGTPGAANREATRQAWGAHQREAQRQVSMGTIAAQRQETTRFLCAMQLRMDKLVAVVRSGMGSTACQGRCEEKDSAKKRTVRRKGQCEEKKVQACQYVQKRVASLRRRYHWLAKL